MRQPESARKTSCQLAALVLDQGNKFNACTSVYLLSRNGRLKYICRTSFWGLHMHTTRAFKNGNSQAVRIPADLAYERTDMELEIEREGDEIRIRPARRSLSGVLAKFARFSPNFMSDGRADHDQAERDSL